MKGLLISFEGGEGAGKGTQVALLKQALEAQGKRVLVTREPGGTPMAEEIRHLLKHHPAGGELSEVAQAEVLLFMASRVLNYQRVILPALFQQKIVLCDRFIDSSVVYQGVVRGLGADNVGWLNNFATQGRKPDLTFLLDLPVKVGFERVRQRNGGVAVERGNDRFEALGEVFFEKIRQAHLELAKQENDRIIVIDASRTDSQIIAQEILQHVKNRMAAVN